MGWSIPEKCKHKLPQLEANKMPYGAIWTCDNCGEKYFNMAGFNQADVWQAKLIAFETRKDRWGYLGDKVIDQIQMQSINKKYL
jgi:hypothetical protein